MLSISHMPIKFKSDTLSLTLLAITALLLLAHIRRIVQVGSITTIMQFQVKWLSIGFGDILNILNIIDIISSICALHNLDTAGNACKYETCLESLT